MVSICINEKQSIVIKIIIHKKSRDRIAGTIFAFAFAFYIGKIE
jgi:hypothetical protein